ncbi:enoyl-CoA hydratase-related protein [Sporosarcina pasteurii]|uniref:Probable enoyl-CoA hydratase echA8 n=1 Tax=Sporosarcina pasteurii TaxID=1474 RepID=A0A380BNH0_SPOPA|nr:enoyl-CoA hydratase-related protein [Sporosarcina pasteurii]MDS9470919.1 enoyl-CoA hydratase-related protein [Sporosarcina pasteurii]SUJ03287.1 Probable enoyl-CoA hydratase echA8 [Sporosarcina pasteurii]
MKKDSLVVTKSNNIATIYINNLEKKNAMTLNMWKKIPVLLLDLENDQDINVVIIRGIDASAFSSGADIEEFAIERTNAVNALNYDTHVTNAGDAIENFSKPVIAMIEGPCIGGGGELALACDLRFSSVTGVFGITPAKIGLVYGVPQTKRLVHTVGPSRAKDILFSGRFFDAKEAYQIGFVDRVYKETEIVEETYNYAKLLVNRSQETIRGAKKITNSILDGMDESKYENEQIILNSYSAPDIQEGIAAFIEKRTPNFNRSKVGQ